MKSSEFLAVVGFEVHGDPAREISNEGAVRPDRAASEAERDPEPSLSGLCMRNSC